MGHENFVVAYDSVEVRYLGDDVELVRDYVEETLPDLGENFQTVEVKE